MEDVFFLRGILKLGIVVFLEMFWDNLGNVVISGGVGVEFCGKLLFFWKIMVFWLFELESYFMLIVLMLFFLFGIFEEIFLFFFILVINLLFTIFFVFFKVVWKMLSIIIGFFFFFRIDIFLLDFVDFKIFGLDNSG